MLVEKSFDHDGHALHYAVGPASGPPLLLLHGVTRLWQDYVPFIPVVQDRWQVFALDFRGHGRSGRRPGHYHVVDYVADAVAFVQGCFNEPVVIHGHSLGALTACGVAAQVPNLVRAVILEDPPAAELIQGIRQTPFHAFFTGMQRLAMAEFGVAERTRVMADMLLPAGSDQPPTRLGDIREATLLRMSARCLQDMDPRALDPLLDGTWLKGYDQAAVMAALSCPALLLRGDMRAGGMMPTESARRLASVMADCTIIDFEGIGHAIHWLAAEKTARHVLAFLESLR